MDKEDEEIRFDLFYTHVMANPDYATPITYEPEEPKVKWFNSNTKRAKTIRLFIFTIGLSIFIIIKS